MKREMKSLWNRVISALTVLAMVIGGIQFPAAAQAAGEYGSYTVNLAQGKNGYASSNQRGDGTIGERKVSNLTDGSTTSYIVLHQDDTDPWVYTDLGKSYSVNKVEVYQGADNAYPNAYAASGKKAEVQTLIQLGQPLTLHASLPETKTTILNGSFDYVIMQDKASNFDGNGLMTGVQQINEWIKQAGAQPVLYMPWANESVLQNTQSYFTSSYVAAAKAIGAKLAPAGEVWYEMYYHYGYRWYSDNIHADNTGSCVSAATIYYTLTGETVPLQFTASDSVVTKNDVDAGVLNLIHMRACAYANAYRDLNNIQNAGAGTLPEKPVEAAFERPVITVTAPVNPYAPDADLTGINLALNKTAAASSGNAAAAVDGKTDSRWESVHGKDGEWITYEFDGSHLFFGLDISWENASGKDYIIQISKDGENWDTVYHITDGKSGETREILFSDHGPDVYETDDIKPERIGNYLRIYGNSRNMDYGYSIWETKVYGIYFALPDDSENPGEEQQPIEPEEPEEKPLPFRDVPAGSWYYDSEKEVYKLGIMTGNSAGTLFTPDGVMTRGMIVNVLYRLDGSPKTSYKAGFKDVDAKKYYATSVNWAVQNVIKKRQLHLNARCDASFLFVQNTDCSRRRK